jgi:hypothetical protein
MLDYMNNINIFYYIRTISNRSRGRERYINVISVINMKTRKGHEIVKTRKENTSQIEIKRKTTKLNTPNE